MVPSSREPWKIWANVLLTIGFGGFFALSLWSFGLIGYYSSERPREPIPERGWTEPLRWTHGYYGSHDENEQLLRLPMRQSTLIVSRILTLGAENCSFALT